jgi:hypothetical protein
MRKFLNVLIVVAVSLSLFMAPLHTTFAAATPTSTPSHDPLSCSIVSGMGDCPSGLTKYYTVKGEKCVSSYSTFLSNPTTFHFWALDEEVTSQGKADERARQFIYWVINTNAIDEHPVLKTVWNTQKTLPCFSLYLLQRFLESVT